MLLLLFSGEAIAPAAPTGVHVGTRTVSGVPLYFVLPDPVPGGGSVITATLTRNGDVVATGVADSPYYFLPAAYGDVFGVRAVDEFGSESAEVTVVYQSGGRQFGAVGRGGARFTIGGDDGSSP
ncbi:hypothetical protein VT84_09355 [Gemmata sp. SH-PL17]|uniref:hypothetical protein n=1 Tax=Gemmata sp. SH-PL17 TaxID=1630693 RepID=UPI00078B9102|nr:hypothetical protein [Gemmata sp. SH-PL17]AMV24590.1 hypothetical protein VT84_09355 [Gemmata sp. SH-PL17]